jgi:hypothetical protein
MESLIAKLPIELISIIFSYTNSSSLLNLIKNNDMKKVINENNIELLSSFYNITKEEMIVWNLLNIIKQTNTYMEWCKILHYADINNKYYKKLYNSFNIQSSSMFTSKKDSKYTIKLKMGLFFINMINNNDNLDRILSYLKLTFDEIEFIFITMKNYPDEFNSELLYYACIAKNKDKYKLNYDRITLAKRLKLLSIYNNKNYYYNSFICKWPEINFNYYINLIMQNINYHVVFELTTPKNKTTEKTVEKFMKLRQELNINDFILSEYFRNQKDINTIKYFQSNGITLKIEELMIMYKITKYKEIIDNILANNKLYNLPIELWNNTNNTLNIICRLVDTDKFTVDEIFNKFTIDQIKHIRIKEFLEDDDLNTTLNYCRIINIKNIANFNNFLLINNNNNVCIRIKIEYIKRAYYELTYEQCNLYFKYIKELDIKDNYKEITEEQNQAFYN